MYKIIFFGTSAIAVPSLEHLVSDGRFEILGVVTQPDRPVGRHAIPTPPPLKIATTRLGITHIEQPEHLKDDAFKQWIEEVGTSCDTFVIVSYGKILPQWLLDLPKHGIVNIHPSLLPRWRGPSPIQSAIVAGDTMTGVSIMKIDMVMDHGPIIAQVGEPIRDADTGQTLHDRLAKIGSELLPDVLASYIDGKITPQPQNDALVTTCKILTRDDGKLDTTKTAQELERRVRAYQPWPGTWIDIDGSRLKILSAKVSTSDRQGIQFLACGGNTMLELTTVQPEGKKPMSGSDFARGRR